MCVCIFFAWEQRRKASYSSISKQASYMYSDVRQSDVRSVLLFAVFTITVHMWSIDVGFDVDSWTVEESIYLSI